jgi:hypothetical protein
LSTCGTCTTATATAKRGAGWTYAAVIALSRNRARCAGVLSTAGATTQIATTAGKSAAATPGKGCKTQNTTDKCGVCAFCICAACAATRSARTDCDRVSNSGRQLLRRAVGRFWGFRAVVKKTTRATAATAGRLHSASTASTASNNKVIY